MVFETLRCLRAQGVAKMASSQKANLRADSSRLDANSCSQM